MDSTTNDFYHELTLRDYSRMVFRHWPVFLTALLVVAATAFVGLKLRTPVYVAQVKMLISSEKETQAPYSRELMGYDRTSINLTQSEIVKSSPVLERAVKVVKLDERPLDYEKPYATPLRAFVLERQVKQFQRVISRLKPEQQDYVRFRNAVDRLRQSVTVEPIRDTSLFVISVRDYDPYVAAALANVVSRSYVIFDLEQQLAEMTIKYGDLHPSVNMLKSQIKRMVDHLNGIPLENIDAIGPATVKIISQAAVPMLPEGKSKKLIFVLAMVMAIFLGLIFSFIFEFLDQTVRTPADLVRVLGLPLLGRIPKLQRSRDILVREPKPSQQVYLSAYHELACQIRFFVNQKKMKVFLFAGPDEGEGTTSIVSNLGLCLAKDFKKSVLMIDANYRQAGVHFNFETSAQPGLIEVLSGQMALSQAVREVAAGLWLLAAGAKESDPENLLDSPKMEEVLNEAKDGFEVVLIDCANLKNYRDAISLAGFVHGLIVVVSEGKSRRPAISAAVAPLKENKFNLIGSVLNNRTFALPQWIYERI